MPFRMFFPVGTTMARPIGLWWNSELTNSYSSPQSLLTMRNELHQVVDPIEPALLLRRGSSTHRGIHGQPPAACVGASPPSPIRRPFRPHPHAAAPPDPSPAPLRERLLLLPETAGGAAQHALHHEHLLQARHSAPAGLEPQGAGAQRHRRQGAGRVPRQERQRVG